MSWVRGPHSTTCSEHSTEWPNDGAETCPHCTPSLADHLDDDAPGEHEKAYQAAIASGLPTLEDYERMFRSTARLARRWAKEAKAADQWGTAARLLAENVKADRAAAEIARERADKAWVERRAKASLRQRRGLAGQARTEAADAGAESIN